MVKYLDEIPPVKPLERPYAGRIFLRFSKYWIACKDPKRRKELFKQAEILGHRLEEELLRQYE